MKCWRTDDRRRTKSDDNSSRGLKARWAKNWRPISLLNTDYKIMTKCIATRLKNNLIKIINKNQSGYIKGRYIGDNIRSLLEVIQLAEEENLSCIVLSKDFEKAFDTISWKLKKKCLSFFNFGESFQQWIKVFFTDITSCVLNTGWTTQFFFLYLVMFVKNVRFSLFISFMCRNSRNSHKSIKRYKWVLL